MEARAKILGHAIHPMVIVFPLGLLATAAIFDAAYLIFGGTSLPTAGFWMIVSGLVGAGFASVFGWIDWTAIPEGTRAKTIGLYHGMVNMTVALVFAIGLYLRWDVPTAPPMIAIVLSFIGVGLALLGGWLGGELVERLGVAVHPGANANAPSSLTHDDARAANEHAETKSS
ncbi:MAG: DUF2231 domain-containing protein [Blastocatellia bacterium]|nr:DUF2231 domain-containing protein [Blastocatellia bacterium]